jgi:hypothetical protein
MAVGVSRMSRATSGTAISSRHPATTHPTACQPRVATTIASRGRNTSRPVELAAPSSPRARPRWVVNQRFTTVALRTRAVLPVLTPTTTPQRR